MRLAIEKATSGKATTRYCLSLLILVLGIGGSTAALQATPSPSTKDLGFQDIEVSRVIVSLSDRRLALLRNGHVVRIYRVAIGKRSTPSPVGDFKIVSRVTNPTYYHKGQVIPAGKNNPVGSRWMGLSAKSYGIHGTNQPSSIGKAASTGCIRMSKHDLEELFTMVEVGDAVEIRADRDQQMAAIFGPSVETVAQAQATHTETVAQAQATHTETVGSGQ